MKKCTNIRATGQVPVVGWRNFNFNRSTQGQITTRQASPDQSTRWLALTRECFSGNQLQGNHLTSVTSRADRSIGRQQIKISLPHTVMDTSCH